MKFISIASLLLAACSVAIADDGLRKSPGHPQLEYRISCAKGSVSILWRNGYPGALSLKARVKSKTYDGVEDVQIAPGGTATSDPDTMSCSLDTLSVSVVKFSMALPPPAKLAKMPDAAPKEDPAQTAVPTLIQFDPHAEKLPEIAPEALTQVSKGMKQEDVVAKLGLPASKLSLQDDGIYVESYQYRLAGDKISIVRFSNGIVSEIIRP